MKETFYAALFLKLLNKKVGWIIPMSGMDSDVSGIFSAMASMKTEKAKRTVIPRAIFSPDSGGKQKTSNVRTLNMKEDHYKINY